MCAGCRGSPASGSVGRGWPRRPCRQPHCPFTGKSRMCSNWRRRGRGKAPWRWPPAARRRRRRRHRLIRPARRRGRLPALCHAVSWEGTRECRALCEGGACVRPAQAHAVPKVASTSVPRHAAAALKPPRLPSLAACRLNRDSSFFGCGGTLINVSVGGHRLAPPRVCRAPPLAHPSPWRRALQAWTVVTAGHCESILSSGLGRVRASGSTALFVSNAAALPPPHTGWILPPMSCSHCPYPLPPTRCRPGGFVRQPGRPVGRGGGHHRVQQPRLAV